MVRGSGASLITSDGRVSYLACRSRGALHDGVNGASETMTSSPPSQGDLTTRLRDVLAGPRAASRRAQSLVPTKLVKHGGHRIHSMRLSGDTDGGMQYSGWRSAR